MAFKPYLPPRQIEVLRLIAHGKSVKECASELGISIHTAKTHMTAILNRLGAKSQAHAVYRYFCR